MTWKNVFPHFWQAPLRGQQLPRAAAATFRPGREQSFRQLPKLVGQKKGGQQQRLLAGKKASSHRPGEEGSPS